MRKVGICKGETWFAPISVIASSVETVDSGVNILRDQQQAHTLDQTQLSADLGKLYAIYNYAHPFREGNGRTGMTWLELVALHFGWHITFDTISTHVWHTASMEAMPRSRGETPRPHPLQELLHSHLIPLV